MTGLEKMVSQILEEADASAAVTISDAEKKAAEILREAGEKADKIRQQREEQSRAKVKSYEERTASAADMKKRTAVLAAKQELIGKVIADACDRVKNLDEGKYFEILKSMAEKYLLPREGEICFSKKDLERMKQLTNQMCRERGLTVVEKGKHFDGSQIEKGEVIAWSKDKYNLFRQQVKDSFVADCAMAVLKALENCISKEKFIEKMKQFGWNVNWTEKRKHITFQNQDGKKVRDSNLSKTFHLDISKEGLENEFNGNYERIQAEAERTNGSDDVFAGYYRQVEAACEGAGGVTGASDGRERQVTGEKSEDERVYPEISGKDTQAENGKTEAILRESRNARRNSEIKRRNSSFDNRTVRNAEAESIASEEQRRFEEQKRLEEQERTRAARRRNKRRSGPEL